MIRVGAVGAPARETSYDGRTAPAMPLVPRPRNAADEVARPPAA
jgi:hypothetical protein